MSKLASLTAMGSQRFSLYGQPWLFIAISTHSQQCWLCFFTHWGHNLHECVAVRKCKGGKSTLLVLNTPVMNKVWSENHKAVVQQLLHDGFSFNAGD